MTVKKIKEMIFNTSFIEYLFFLIILLSLPYSDKTPVISDKAEILGYMIFFYFIIARAMAFKNDPLRRTELRPGFDEYIILAICVTGILAAVLYSDSIGKGIKKPLMFFIAYLGISSYAKINEITEKFIIRLLFCYIAVALIHSIVEYCFSFQALFNYFTGKIKYSEYLNSSWNLLYPNYNYFARNVMIGFICSLSIYLFYLVKEDSFYKKTIIFILICFFGTTILLSFSRTSILAAAVYALLILTYFIIIYRDKINKFITIKNVVFILCACCLLLYFLIHYDFISAIIVKTKNQGSTHRFGLWKSFIEQEINLLPDIKFFIGHGYRNKSTDISTIWANITGNHVHNNFLFIWYNYGFISMVMFIILLIKMWISNFKVMSRIWFIYFIPLSYMCVANFESQITKANLRLEVIFFFIFLLLPYNMYLKNLNKTG